MGITSGAEGNCLTDLSGLGEKSAERLREAGINDISDLLRRLPSRYVDRSHHQDPSALVEGDEGWLSGVVRRINYGRPRGRRTRVTLYIDCGAVEVRAHWFINGRFAAKQAPKGSRVLLWAKVGSKDDEGFWQVVHPELVLDEGEGPPPEGIRPIYGLPEGVGPKRFTAWIAQSIEHGWGCEDWAGLDSMRDELELPSIHEALRTIHQPSHYASITDLNAGRTAAHESLALEALFAQQLVFLQRRQAVAASPPLLCAGDRNAKELIKSLPFSLSPAQQRVRQEIQVDLGSGRPMRRLLQGDVGAGKTIPAILAAVAVVEHGGQAALVAPTELIARQQLRLLQKWAAPLGIEVAGLWASLDRASRSAVTSALASGKASIVAGTHALFSSGISFSALALVVFDEQHRFGVDQRRILVAKGQAPHILAMSATPIPRSLALSLHGDMDLSVMEHRPHIRKVKTTLGTLEQELEIATKLQESGARVFVVCPRKIEGEDEVPNVIATARRWRAIYGRNQVAVLHGGVRGDKRAKAIDAFAAGRCSVLVATTVVEVGVDVDGADTMVVLGAERFGLSTLHQLRGRIGRQGQQAHCYLLLGTGGDHARVEQLLHIDEGMRLAEADLVARGPGEFLGLRQSGAASAQLLQCLRWARHADRARQKARQLLASSQVSRRAKELVIARAQRMAVVRD